MNYREIDRASRKRAYEAAAMRYDGLTFREIGRQMGVTLETARQAVMKGERLIERNFATINHCAELIARFATKSKGNADV